MSCNETKKGRVQFDGDCKCQNAVLSAYKNLLSAGMPEPRALEAAKIVYGHHHPEDPADQAGLTVERWINAEHLH
jgi:hypothetical protein